MPPIHSRPSQPHTLLSSLFQNRTSTSTPHIDADTLDSEWTSSFLARYPFVNFTDATSNQAIALAELSKKTSSSDETLALKHARLINSAAKWSHENFPSYHSQDPQLTLPEFTVEVLTVSLARMMAPHLTPPKTGGPSYIHIQVNPTRATSTTSSTSSTPDPTTAITTNAIRLTNLFTHIPTALDLPGGQGFQLPAPPPPEHVTPCIKIPLSPATAPACLALAQLHSAVAVLGTIVFDRQQVKLAREAKCAYIAPYVNELKVHFDAGYIDEEKESGFHVCEWGKRWYGEHDAVTERPPRVMPASLTSVGEVMRLCGMRGRYADHITISPGLLDELGGTLFDGALIPESLSGLGGDPRDLDADFGTAAGAGEFSESSRRKYDDALRIFRGCQGELEKIAEEALGRV